MVRCMPPQLYTFECKNVTPKFVVLNSGELRHGTCHFYTIYTGISKIGTVYGNLKDQMKLDLCICEALSYTLVPWKPQLWAWLSITTNIN